MFIIIPETPCHIFPCKLSWGSSGDVENKSKAYYK